VLTFRILVHNVEKAKAFYVDLLGFEIVEQWGPAIAIIRKDSTTLWLSGPSSSAARPLSDGAKPVPGGWNRLAVQVESLEDFMNRASSMGFSPRNEPISGPGGTQVLYEDSGGNVVEIFEPRSD
jgi:catechol 2,3-dioxygenase-like lactoylglutathione lyase family enzyme